MFSFQRPTDSFRVVYYYIATQFVCQHLFLIFLQILLNIFYKLSSLVYSITNNIFCQQQILIFFIFLTKIHFYAIFTLFARAHAYTHTHILYIDNRKIIRFYVKKMVGTSNHLISIKII
jgi:hypothetical protein